MLVTNYKCLKEEKEDELRGYYCIGVRKWVVALDKGGGTGGVEIQSNYAFLK